MTAYFHSWHAFWHMGGYAAFVWPTYAIVLVSLIAVYFGARFSLSAELRRIKKTQNISKHESST